jgi:plasmid stabilization system protein ParE
MYYVKITDTAEEDILSSVKYIADVLKAPMAANNLLDEIKKHEEILENTPGIFPRVPNEYLASIGFRFTIVKNYLMFYSINEDEKTVDVHRFLYGHRDWINILTENQ